ncbi:cell division protein ZapE [Pseudomonas sp. PA-6-1D]|uniref:cell division protein ZapE n=1 Tax=Pseudomonas TaxID=286 RepID=UPI001EED2EE4|nr:MULTISPECIES: cell division protein ZapE [Pseudomonas]MCF5140527.1 cell division protein ZapE [Pseudomonas sp. PA-6-3C]MCF5150940.1 cell division protein ZapE [Pseudomonas sp. PA-6-3F]MCF5157877.1 cell division protein ZapE [Pseudomonas sp. PA-6-2E]MCF5174490.1 cell division protein ZapE [Pseudomonas sp. PA-6-1D]MCF5194187.1 cell division protein ZapE [Pseudomonas sp. PA-6-1H]
MTFDSPLAAYQYAIAQQGFVPDDAQCRAVQALQTCFEALHHGRLPIPGVYLWGPVGRGKTWLMDQFYHSLRVPARRQHFHHFMGWVHQRSFQLSGIHDPLQALARELSQDVRVLCFDELFVSDIGDAIILGRLFQVMFEEGVVMVCTSNQPPDELYAGGFNRERFLPGIEALKQHMHVVAVDGGEDHRLHPGVGLQRYWVNQPQALATLFKQLSEGRVPGSGVVSVGYRSIVAVQSSDTVLWCRYADLCEQPLAAMDFMLLCDRYKAILLGEVPNLSAQKRPGRIARGTEDGVQRVMAGDRELPELSVHDDSVRRFIALVDECYDRKVPLFIEAQVPLASLYTEGYLEFAFRRTLSRLQEMQLQRFGA